MDKERLSEKLKDTLYECVSCTNQIQDEIISKALERLKVYENAEAEGRLVVLPCKVGDKVYVVGERRIVECEIEEAYLDDVKGLEFLVSYRCGYPEDGDECCKGCPFYGWHQQYCGEWSCEGEWGNAAVLSADIGKTVFHTHEDAEAKLKKGRCR